MARTALSHRGFRLALEQLEDRALPSTVSAASATSLFVIRPDASVWANVAPLGWFALTSAGFATSISAVMEPTGNYAVFALTPANTVYGYRPQTGWFFLGGFFDSISAGLDQVGSADLFARTAGGSLFEFNSSGAFHLGDAVSKFAASNNDVVVTVLFNNAVWAHSAALGWFALTSPGFAQSVSVYPDAAGNQVVFALTPSGTLFSYTVRSGWIREGSTFSTISGGRDQTGNSVCFAATAAGNLYEFFPSVGTVTFVGSFVASISGADTDRVFSILTDG